MIPWTYQKLNSFPKYWPAYTIWDSSANKKKSPVNAFADYPAGLETKIQIRKFYERKFVKIFLSINLNMCFGCSKETPYRGGSFEYPQHMFWLRNKENIFPIRTLIWRPVECVILTWIVLLYMRNKGSCMEANQNLRWLSPKVQCADSYIFEPAHTVNAYCIGEQLKLRRACP